MPLPSAPGCTGEIPCHVTTMFTSSPRALERRRRGDTCASGAHRLIPEPSAGTEMKGRDLVNAYALGLEHQITERGSSLACRDEELWKEMEGLLMEGDPQEVHCLGLDPLRVMEESLKAATTPACSRRPTARGGLQGLAQAFEVLEQAALNLYLGPWRTEYKVIKMYSGMFTHHVTPALSMPQIENLFGLLGYEASPSRPEQLFLQTARVGASSLDDVLRLACAFFVARCECRLILEALGKWRGDIQWELSMVKERQRGNGLQVALDNTKRTLEVCQPLELSGGGEEDLYREELVNGGQRRVDVNNEESSPSSMWGPQSIVSAPAVKTPNDGVSSPLESDTSSKKQDRRPGGESRAEKTDSHCLQVEVKGLSKREPEVNHYCSCIQSSPPPLLQQCTECNTLHDLSCASLNACRSSSHRVAFFDKMTNEMNESATLSTQRGSLKGKKQERRPAGASRSVTTDSQSSILQVEVKGPSKREPEVNHYCSCLPSSPPPLLQQYTECNTLHNIACPSLEACRSNSHRVVYADRMTEDIQESAAVSPQRGSLRGKKQDRHPGGESRSVKTDSQSDILQIEMKDLSKREPEVDPYCSCLQSSPPIFKHCIKCNTLHNITCASLDVCRSKGHSLVYTDQMAEDMKVSAAVALERESLRGKTQDRHPGGESRSVKTESQSSMLYVEVKSVIKREPEVNHYCSCLQSPAAILRLCIECDALHDIVCASLDVCRSKGHRVDLTGTVTEEIKESAAVSPASKTHISNTAAISTLALHDDAKSITPSLPTITFHSCCDLNQLDPQFVCHTCKVFHRGSCPDKELCLKDHDVRELGQCSCGRYCSRKPLVLCRYCGREYCSLCWYKTPVSCSCGQTFDQGSPV